MKARVAAWYLPVLLLAAAGWGVAGFSAEILLPSADGATLGPDDTLELVLRPAAAAGLAGSEGVEVSAWVLASEESAPAAGTASTGRAQIWPSPTKPGEWLVHLRGLKAPVEKPGGRRWDLLVRWRFADGTGGESRLKGVLAFRSDLPDVVLLLDSSDSMGLNDPNRLRVEAARTFLIMALRSGGIGRVAVVQFASKVRVLLALTPVQETEAFLRAFQEVRESGMTDIDGSLRSALDLLGKGTRENPPAVVLLTDGKQEPGEYREAHKELAAAGIPVHTVALGKSADRVLLRRISDDTGGTFSDAARDQDLLRLYGAIASRIAGGRRISSAELPVAGGATEFPVDGSCRLLATTVSEPGTLELTQPGGDLLAGREEPHPVAYITSPATGAWRARWSPAPNQAAEQRPVLESLAHTPLYPLFFRSKVERAAPVEIDVDDPWLACSLGEDTSVYPAEVRAAVVWGDAAPVEVALLDDGQHGDGVAGDGVSAGALPDAARPAPGATGTIRLVAVGQRGTGEGFQREIDTPCMASRGGVRQLITSGPLDLGECWLGDVAAAEVSVRVRGAGGRLEATLHRESSQAQGEQAEVAKPDLRMTGLPAELKPRQTQHLRLQIALPEYARPGIHSGRIDLVLQGLPGQPPVLTSVPWRVLAKRPHVTVDPAWVNLGTVTPGKTRTATVRVATRGGRVTVSAVHSNRLMEPPTGGDDGTELLIREAAGGPLEITPQGRTVTVELHVRDYARAGGRLWAVELLAARGTPYGSFVVQSDVTLQWLKLAGSLAFGRVESGDRCDNRVDCVLTDGQTDQTVPVAIGVGSLHPGIRADWVNEAAGRGTLSLRIGQDVPDGVQSGGLDVRFGPAWLHRAWTAEVIRPVLTMVPQSLDLGACFPGRTLRGQFTATLRGARAAEMDLSLDDPPRKPAVPHIWMPNSVVGLPVNHGTIEPGLAFDLPIEVRVPDGAQDGEYSMRLRIDSRLGRQLVTAHFRVDSPVPLPLFHISPPEVTLKVARDGSPFPVDLTIRSHVDRALRITARVRPERDGSEAPAELLAEGSDACPELTFMLPPRAEMGLQVQGRASSRDGDTCGILFTGEKEEQEVRATVQRSRVLDTAGLGVEARSRYDWLRLLLFILLLILLLVIMSLSKRKWIRYATYALVSHAALMLMAVPPSTVVNALPPSVQLTLVGQPPDEVVETSPEQARRIRDLPSVVALKEKEQPQESDARSALEAPELGKGPESSAPDAPSTPAELAQASAPVAPTQVELKQPERARSQEALDAALSLDAPSAPSPEPVQKVEPDRAPEEASLTAAPAPISPPPPALPRDSFVPETRTAIAQATVQVERREVPIPVSAPATRVAATTEDLPLSVDPVQMPTTDLAAVSPQKGVVELRATPVGTASTMLYAQPIAFRLPAGGQADQVRPDAVAQGTLAPETGWARLVHGTGTGAALTGSYERGAGAPGAGHGDLPLDLGKGQGFTKGGQGTGQGPSAPAGRLRPAGSGTSTATGAGAGGEPLKLGGGSGTAETASIGGAGGTGSAVARLGGDSMVGEGTHGGHGNLVAEARGGGRGGTGDAPLDFGGAGTGTAQRDAGEGQGGRGTAPTGPRLPAGSGGWTGVGGGMGGPRLDGLGLGKGTVDVQATGGGRSDVGARLDSLALERAARGSARTASSSRGLTGIRPLWGPADSTSMHIRLGLAKHGGDWDSSPTALLHLASAFRERCGLPALEVTVQNVPLTDVAVLRNCALVLVTSNDPIPWKPAELDAMRAYMAGGGLVWVNDSSATGDERFDQSFQSMLPKLLPGVQLRRLEWDHPLFTAAYDLTRGYKGYPLPPGDKYREEFARGIRMNVKGKSRVALLYTRNDYADGLEIDPRSIAGMKSLTDLAPDEMLEGALRFGINTLAYALGAEAPRMPPPPESAAEIAKLYRYQGAPLPIFDEFERNIGDDGTPIWAAEEWGNPGILSLAHGANGQELCVQLKAGDKGKVGISRLVDLDLSSAKAVVIDLHSGLPEGFNASLLFSVKPDWDGYETRPLFIRPGWNRNLRFPLTLDDFKASKNDWKEYNSAFQPRAEVARLSILLYNLHVDGNVLIDNLRIER